MKPWIKLLIAGVIGFGGGFATGFFLHKKMNDAEFVEISEEEMAEIEDELEKQREILKEQKARRDDILAERIEKAGDDPQKLRMAMEGKTTYQDADEKAKIAYHEMWQATKNYSGEENANRMPVPDEDISEAEEDGPSEDEFDEEFLEMIEEEEADPGSGFVEPPHLISLGDFYNDRPEFDKITIDYFEEDNTWLDENEEVIADISSYVGMNSENLFMEPGPDDDPDIRFVRNEGYSTDYEIIRHHRSWAETSGEE